MFKASEAISNASAEQLPVDPANSAPGKGGLARVLLGGVTGLAGAFAAWKSIGLIGQVAALPPDLSSLAFASAPSPEDLLKVPAATLKVNQQNAAVWLGVSGAILGCLLGLLVYLAQRSAGAFLKLLFIPTICGAVAGAAAGAAAVYINHVARQNMNSGATSPSEQITLVMHSVTWLTLGLGVGFGIALSRRPVVGNRFEPAIFTGIAGMAGGCLYPIVAGLFFVAVNSSSPIPYLEPAAGRILWLSLPSVLMGLAVGRNP